MNSSEFTSERWNVELYLLYVFLFTTFGAWLSALASDIYLIVIIVRLKKIRTRLNMLILLYAIFHIVYLAFWLAERLAVSEIVVIIATSMELLMNFCLTLLAITWYVRNYHPALNSKFSITIKFGLGICFLIISTTIGVYLILFNYGSNYRIYFIIELACFMFCWIILIILTILKRYGQPASAAHKTAYAILIPQIVVIMSVLGCLLGLLSKVLQNENQVALPDQNNTYIFKQIICIVFQGISISLFLAEPIVVLYILAKSNKHFKMAHLKCCKKNLQNYEDDDLDSNSVTETLENNVTFHTSSENIRL